jgi:hypothetical protein
MLVVKNDLYKNKINLCIWKNILLCGYKWFPVCFCHLNFFFVSGKCNVAQELAGERPMAFLRMPLLLLHARMLHVAGHLFIEEGNLNLFLI